MFTCLDGLSGTNKASTEKSIGLAFPLTSLQGSGDLLQGLLLVCLSYVLGYLLGSKIDGLPARIDMQMKVEDILTGCWLIRLSQVNPFTRESHFDGTSDLNSRSHNVSTSCAIQGINVGNMLLGNDKWVIFL